MIKSKKDYQRYLQIEKDFYYNSYSHFTYELKQILKFIQLYRKVEYYHNCRTDFIGKIYYKYLSHHFDKISFQYSISLPINIIEEGLCIIHLGPIQINPNVKIGKYLKIHPMTTIGKTIGTDNTSPTLGDHIWIGPGTRIYGNINIQNNVVIGANSVVNKSFGPNQTIAGSPAKKINSKCYEDYFQKKNH